MSDAAAESPVAELRSKLHELSEWSARCKEAAEQAANALISAPSVEQLRERDRQRELAEVADLEVERVKRALVEAEEQERQEGIQERLTRHGPAVQEPAAASERRLREHVLGAETAIAELNGFRNASRVTTRALLALGHNEAVQVGLRVDDEVLARLIALVQKYKDALKRVDTGQVSHLLGRERAG